MKGLDALLAKVTIFKKLTAEEILQLVPFFSQKDFTKDSIIFDEGTYGSELFIVASGEVAAFIKLPDATMRKVAHFTTGDFFGDMAIFENDVRSATCIAQTDCTLLSLTASDFFTIINSHPSIAIKIMYDMLTVISQRLLKTGSFLTEMIQWGEAARKRSIIDEFTGVYNRSYFEDTILLKITQEKPFCLIMVDLDYFRKINEEYSHEVGDKAILAIVEVLKATFRDVDAVCRYGGDEFAVIFDGNDVQSAYRFAEIARNKVNAIDSGKLGITNLTLSLSMGIAAFPTFDKDIIRAKADEALYRAKERGRNCVVLAQQ
ncbi:MAG: GGDEF domain-containing protein [Spirochaetes bacterium]|nr:GGDEF domain-containing protein [Spirochaetota bacterium]